MTKRTKITIETESLLIVRSRSRLRQWCPPCAAEREMVAIDPAGFGSDGTPVAAMEWLRSEHLHRSCSADGSLLVCLHSLLALGKTTKSS